MSDPSPARPVKWYRVWVALAVPSLALAAVFSAFAAYFLVARGVPAAELLQAMEPVVALPVSLGFALAFVVVRWLAKLDGLSLTEVGWRRPSPADVAVGLGAAAVLWAVNSWALYPLLQAAQPSFDPTLAKVWLPGAVVMFAIAVAAEETLYRGYAFTALQARHGTLVAMGVSTVAYALLTPGPELPLKLWALYFGAVLCALQWWRDNLWPAALAHAWVSLGPKLLASLAAS